VVPNMLTGPLRINAFTPSDAPALLSFGSAGRNASTPFLQEDSWRQLAVSSGGGIIIAERTGIVPRQKCADGSLTLDVFEPTTLHWRLCRSKKYLRQLATGGFGNSVEQH
jgi:hypothetical protein